MITAITGGKVITVTGQTYEKATVLTEDGKIKAIGTDLTIPEGAQVIDACLLYSSDRTAFHSLCFSFRQKVRQGIPYCRDQFL